MKVKSIHPELESIFLIVLVCTIILSGILYLFYLNSDRRINISRYWNVDKKKASIGRDVQNEFNDHESKIKDFKQLLEIVVLSRNNAQKGLNELKVLFQDFSDTTQFSSDDLLILKNIGNDTHSLRENLSKAGDIIGKTFSEQFTTLTNDYIRNLKACETSINKVVEAQPALLKKESFIAQEIKKMEKSYSELINIHSQLIKEFQTIINIPIT